MPVVNDRNRAAGELLVLVGALVFHLWIDSRQILSKPARSAVTVFTATVVVVVLARQKPSLAETGFHPPSWTSGLGVLAGATALGMAGVFTVGYCCGTLGAADRIGYWLGQVWHLEGLQQLLLNGMLVPRLAVLFGAEDRRTTLAASAVFAALHLPNPILTPATFVAAWFWVEWFRRHRNLPALWISHLLMGWSLIVSLDGDLLRRMRVGIAWVFYP